MDGEYLDLTEAAKLAPGRPHVASVWRWCRRGVKVRGSGERVTLQHIRAGGRLYTTAADLERFFQAVSAADAQHFQADEPTPAHRRTTSGQREKQIAGAERRLAARGIL